MALISFRDMMRAQSNFNTVSKYRFDFSDFINDERYKLPNWHDYTQYIIEVDDRQMVRYNMLLGPHYEAIIKAWIIRNGKGLQA